MARDFFSLFLENKAEFKKCGKDLNSYSFYLTVNTASLYFYRIILYKNYTFNNCWVSFQCLFDRLHMISAFKCKPQPPQLKKFIKEEIHFTVSIIAPHIS